MNIERKGLLRLQTRAKLEKKKMKNPKSATIVAGYFSFSML
jgi:hypothetical protein